MKNVRKPKEGGEKYKVSFYTSEWEELPALSCRRLSAVGAVNLVSDFLSSRTDDSAIAGLMVAHLREASGIMVEVDRG